MARGKADKSDDDLLDDMPDPFNEGDGDGEWDLLNQIDEDDAEGWVPKERGDGIQGCVIKVGTTRSDFSDDPVPVVTIEQKDGTKVRIIGFGAVLRREILDADPQPGDRFACKYWGKKPVKNGKYAGKPYHHYNVLVKHREPVGAGK